VDRVIVEVAVPLPGVTLVGENEALQPRGSPVARSETAASNVP
jgi:hypothetical protein